MLCKTDRQTDHNVSEEDGFWCLHSSAGHRVPKGASLELVDGIVGAVPNSELLFQVRPAEFDFIAALGVLDIGILFFPPGEQVPAPTLEVVGITGRVLEEVEEHPCREDGRVVEVLLFRVVGGRTSALVLVVVVVSARGVFPGHVFFLYRLEYHQVRAAVPPDVGQALAVLEAQSLFIFYIERAEMRTNQRQENKKTVWCTTHSLQTGP
jgi:hypothetical protein